MSASLQQSAVLVSAFTADTARLLNHFAHSSHSRMDAVDERLDDLEVTLTLLEARLNSVEGGAGALPEPASAEPQARVPQPQSSSAPPPPPPPPPPPSAPIVAPPSASTLPPPETPPAAQQPATGVVTNKTSDKYAKFFKMLAVGVPAGAVANKMRLELQCADAEAILAAPDAPFSG